MNRVERFICRRTRLNKAKAVYRVRKLAAFDDLEIAPGYSISCWKNLRLDQNDPNSVDWKKALDIFDTRIRCRFFEPADRLIEFEEVESRKTFGFAVLAIDFLVIETLQGFREGVVKRNYSSTELFMRFMIQWNAFKDCVPVNGNVEDLAKLIYKDYRCALYHSGSTTGAFRVGISGPMFDFRGGNDVKLNRTCFHKNLKLEFQNYLNDLRRPAEDILRANFKKKMNTVCGLGTSIDQ